MADDWEFACKVTDFMKAGEFDEETTSLGLALFSELMKTTNRFCRQCKKDGIAGKQLYDAHKVAVGGMAKMLLDTDREAAEKKAGV